MEMVCVYLLKALLGTDSNVRLPWWPINCPWVAVRINYLALKIYAFMHKISHNLNTQRRLILNTLGTHRSDAKIGQGQDDTAPTGDWIASPDPDTCGGP